MEENKKRYDDQFLESIIGVDFIDVEDLFKNRHFIRKNYKKLKLEYKKVFKWYFYFKLCLIKNPLKDMLWDYISGFNVPETDLIGQYMAFLSKKKAIMRRQKQEDSEID